MSCTDDGTFFWKSCDGSKRRITGNSEILGAPVASLLALAFKSIATIAELAASSRAACLISIPQREFQRTGKRFSGKVWEEATGSARSFGKTGHRTEASAQFIYGDQHLAGRSKRKNANT